MNLRAGRWLALCVLVSTIGVIAVPQAAGVTAVTRYVVSTGEDTLNDCTDSANPCASLQYAIDQANAGDTIDVAGTIDSNVTILQSLTITQWPDQASAVLDGTSSGRVVTIDGGSAGTALSVTLSDLMIENGVVENYDAGGGVANIDAALTVDNVTLSDNSAVYGGGIASGDGTLTVAHSTFSNNSAWQGGAIADVGTLTVEDSTFSGNSSGSGGGGAILELGSGTLLRSTLTGNSAGGNGAGGGVEVLVPPSGGPATPASLLVADSTFTDNSAVAGGAIASNGSITVENSTLTGNSAAGGAAVASANLNVLFAADIFAKQASGTNCYFSVSPIGPVDAGYNVDDDGTCGLNSANHSVSDSSAIDDYLGSLADNGGPTQTAALLNTPNPVTAEADPALAAVPVDFVLSEAIDGQTAACSVPDQRGVTPAARIRCDIGAYLLQQTTTGLTTSHGSVLQGHSVTYTATVSPTPDGGTVTFSDGSGNPATLNCAAQPLTAGKATCTVSYSNAGVVDVTAEYSGDGASNNDAASASNPLVETIHDTATPSTRYVVSTGGDDADNDCIDSASPCATLQYAIDQANAGDTIDVAGTFDSNVTILKSLTITEWRGYDAVLDGTNSGRVVTIGGQSASTPLSVTLSDLTIENGNSDTGGGVLNIEAALMVDNVTFSHNSASGPVAAGGGIGSDGTLTVKHSTFSNNSSTYGGGAIADGGTMTVEDSTFSDNSTTPSPFGGGAIVETGTGTVLRSTFVGNSAGHGSGGGIFVAVAPSGPVPATPASLLVADSTLTGNSADVGGAIASNGSITVESSTLTGNSATVGGAAIASANLNVLFAADIFAEPSGTNCAFADSPVGPVDAGYNIDDDGTCGLSSANHSVSDSSAIDHYLGSLTDNYGRTQTIPLLNTPSPATPKADPALGVVPDSFDLPEAVDGETAACSVPDQRGVTPAAGIGCDVGAYLLQPTTVSLTASSRRVQPGGSVTYTATVYPVPDDGIVTFSDNADDPLNLGCVTGGLTYGKITCTVAYPDPRVISVTAAYSGDGWRNDNYAASTSSPLTVTIRDTHRPSKPGALTGRIAENALRLSWQPSQDNIGVDHYEVYLGNAPLRRVAGTATKVTVHTFHRHGASIFTVRALDAAGNRSGPSDAVTVKPVPRPKSAPKLIPRWAWQLLAWQEHNVGAKPITPHPLPHWYAPWKKWREELFRLLDLVSK